MENMMLLHSMNHTKTVEKSVDFVKEVELEGTVNAVCKPKIYGNSVQENVPAPNNPIPILSTGDEGKIELWARNKNYAPELDKWNLSGGAYIDEEGWIVIPQEGAKAWVDVDWKYVNNIFNITAEFYTNATNNNRLMNTLYYDANGNGISENGNLVAIQASEITKTQWTIRVEPYTSYIKQSWKIRLYIQWHSNNSTGEFKFRNVTFNPFDFIDYVKHRSNTIVFPLAEPLRKVRDVADYIDWENKVVVRNCGSRILNGTENWGSLTASGESGRNGYVSIQMTLSNMKYGNYMDGYSTHFKLYTSDMGTVLNDEGVVRFGANSYQLYFYIKDKYFVTTEDWVNWLANNPVEVIYQLNTPIEQPFSQEQLAVAELMTTQKNCTISVITETEPSKVELKYLKMGVK